MPLCIGFSISVTSCVKVTASPPFNNNYQSDKRKEKQTLIENKQTFHNIRDELQVCGQVLDLVQAGKSCDGDILIAVHLRFEVEVTAKVFPVQRQRSQQKELMIRNVGAGQYSSHWMKQK